LRCLPYHDNKPSVGKWLSTRITTEMTDP
jgi:hypothetical protein